PRSRRTRRTDIADPHQTAPATTDSWPATVTAGPPPSRPHTTSPGHRPKQHSDEHHRIPGRREHPQFIRRWIEAAFFPPPTLRTRLGDADGVSLRGTVGRQGCRPTSLQGRTCSVSRGETLRPRPLTAAPKDDSPDARSTP